MKHLDKIHLTFNSINIGYLFFLIGTVGGRGTIKKKTKYTLIGLMSVLILITALLLLNQKNHSSTIEFGKVVEKVDRSDQFVIIFNNESGETKNILVEERNIWNEVEVGKSYTFSYDHNNVLTSLYPERYTGRIE